MISNTLQRTLNSFRIRNNMIMPANKTFEKMNMTRQQYFFYKWSHHRNLRPEKLNGSDGGTTSDVRKLSRRLV